MKILHLVHSVRLEEGGLPAVALNLTASQRKIGIDARIWCFDEAAAAEKVAASLGLSGAVQAWKIVPPRRLCFSPQGLRAICSPEAHSFDLVHQHGIWQGYSCITRRWRSRTGKPTIVAPHGSLEPWALERSRVKKALVLAMFERRNLRESQYLHATCAAELASIRRFRLKNRVLVLPNGVPEEIINRTGNPRRFRQHFGIPADMNVMLFLGRIHPKKGIPMLLEALNKQSSNLRDWLLFIVGADENGHLSDIKRLSKAYNLEARVRFCGPLFGDEKLDAFAAADLFVLPTHSENFAITVAEALGLGVPVLTTKGAPWEEILAYDCGWWVEPNVASLEGAIAEAMACSKPALKAKGQRGTELIKTKYRWDRIAESSAVLYTEIIKGQFETRPDS